MSNEPSWDEIFSKPDTSSAAGTTEPPLTRRQLRQQEAGAGPKRSTFASVSGSNGRPPRKKRRLRWLWGLLIILAIVIGGGYALWNLFETEIRELTGWELPIDYDGSGNGEPVDVVVAQGDTGTDIANTLAKEGVTLTSKAFYDAVITEPAPPTFQPGTYELEQHMSARSALTALLDIDNRVISKIVIPEGRILPQVEQLLSENTGVPMADFEAEAANPVSFGIPADAPGLEGFLFPATYTFDPGVTAHDMLQTLVDRMTQALDEAGVTPENRVDVLTLASIIQKEGGVAEDFPKVSRVFTNRLEQGMPLQSDATVTYGTGGSSIFTTQDERDDATNLYNTYANPGLPVGPISAPGDAAIEAALNPVEGDWMYFVLVNGDTGETKFSTTLAEHEEGVAQFQQWLRENPDYETGG